MRHDKLHCFLQCSSKAYSGSYQLLKQTLIVVFFSFFSSNAYAAWEYYWWNQGGFNCLGPWSPGGPSFHTNSLHGTLALTLQKSKETNLANPGYCITLKFLRPVGSPYFDDSYPQFPWVIPVAGQTGPEGGNRYFTDIIRIKGTGPHPKNTGLTCFVGSSINPGTGNKFDRISDYAGHLSEANLSFERIYNSTTFFLSNDIGWGWTHNYSARLGFSPNGSRVSIARPDGKIFVFRITNGRWMSDADIQDELLELKDPAGVRTGWRYRVAANNSEELFNATGHLISITDIKGYSQTLTYSDSMTLAVIAQASGLLIRVTDTFGKQLNFTYDSGNRISTLSDPAGNVTNYQYDAVGNLKTIIYPDDTPDDLSNNPKKTYVYGSDNGELVNTGYVDQPNVLTGSIDENGNRYAAYQYDDTGKAIATEFAGGVEIYSLAFSADATHTTVTDPLGSIHTTYFTTIGDVVKPVSHSQPAGSGCTASANAITYDTNGNVSSRTDFNGNRINYSYDLTRNLEMSRTEGLTLSGTSTSESRTIITEWHPIFRLPTKVMEPGLETTYTYDNKGHVTHKSVKDTISHKARDWHSQYSYSTSGILLQKVEDGSRIDVSDTVTYDYYPEDADCTGGHFGCRGQLKQITNSLGHVTRISRYSANGQPELIIDPNGITTTMVYDARQRLVSYVVSGEVTTYGYDRVGLLTRVTEPSGAFMTYYYDNAHRLIEIRDQLGNTQRYTLDKAGNRIKDELFDPHGQLARSQSRVYDALSRLQNLSLPH